MQKNFFPHIEKWLKIDWVLTHENANLGRNDNYQVHPFHGASLARFYFIITCLFQWLFYFNVQNKSINNEFRNKKHSNNKYEISEEFSADNQRFVDVQNKKVFNQAEIEHNNIKYKLTLLGKIFHVRLAKRHENNLFKD